MMKTTITEVKIAEPCSQNWDEMENRNENKFCLSCQKCVIDFSGYTNEEIIKTLANADSEICGRLSQTQLNQLNYYLLVIPPNRSWMKYLGVLAIGASIFTQDAKATVLDNKVEISMPVSENPKVKTEDIKINRIFYGFIFLGKDKPAVGLKLQIKNTKFTAITDKSGRYQFIVDDNFDRKSNVLIIKESKFVTEFPMNFNSPKQNDYYPSTITEPMVLGKIMYVPKKGNKFL
ncbi:hypothetical protein [Pedobacter jamesrossensis]|uniref:Carboxypeptidase regulatory-like domain-containing protein n=1 Tax=Pedobacter jamesrossensis TaxID=1908238 RepID=A0ABV8NIC3_9SPHI